MLSSPTSSSSLFASFSARPPTPPRDISDDVDEAFRFLQEGHRDNTATATAGSTQAELLRVESSVDTPPQQSPASSQARASIVEKRVDFSPFPTVHSLPQAGKSGSPASRSYKQTPLRHLTGPLKSILKVSNDRLPLTPDDLESKLSYFSPQEPDSFRKMLHSVLAQLASKSRDDRRDAYLAINGAMKHYEAIPDPPALCEKMTSLQQFILRDLNWKDPTGRLDSSMVTQALQLTMALMHNLETEQALDDDFRNLLVERSIAVLEQNDIPKSIYKLHMFLLSQQRFKSQVLTATRADKLLTILQGCEHRCTGNGIIASRLIVYLRLLKQAPSVMLNRMRDWIEFVFHGMLSTIPDVRARAIDTCAQAGLILGDKPQAARVMYELAEKEEGEGQTYGDHLNTRLKEMSADKETAKWVPQIWAAVILLFRCKRRPLEKWPCFKDWLATIQRSLNSSDMEVKQYANIAWNKLVYAVMPDTGTTESMRSMLRIPIMAGLEKRGNDRVSHLNRQIAMNSYCNLLHYGLRPGLSSEALDQAWDLYVEPILTKMAMSGARPQYNVCCVLQGILQKDAGVWNKNAANESGPIKPADLPRLDPRWIRSRLMKLIKVLEPVMVSGMWMMPDTNEAANTCWRLLLESVAEAGSQEVKASNELKEAIAQFTNFFRRIWNGDWQSRNEVEGHVWLDRFNLLLETAIDCLGAVHFVEDVLSKKGEDDLEAAPTPSRRNSKHSVVAYPAFVFLYALYYHPPSPLHTTGLYKSSAATFVRLFGSAKGSAAGTLALLHSALEFVATTRTDQNDVSGHLWNIVVCEAVEALQIGLIATSQRDAQAMGNGLRSAINILLYGLRYADSSSECLEKAVQLYGAACQSSKHCANEGGVVLGVMEPFAKSAVELLDELSIHTGACIGKALLVNGSWPKSRHELDYSRKALWKVSLELPRSPFFDPFEHVYNFLNGLLARSYDSLTKFDHRTCQVLCDLMESLIGFLRRSPPSILPVALRKTQAGLVHWIKDRRRVLFPLEASALKETQFNYLHTMAVCTVDAWFALTTILEGLPRKDSALLHSIEPLFVAAFSSPSRDIVKQTISIWNTTFGQLPQSDYPSQIRSVLYARRNEADLELPGFPHDDTDMDVANLPAFPKLQQHASASRGLADFQLSHTPPQLPKHTKTDRAENSRIKQNLYAIKLHDMTGLATSSAPQDLGKATVENSLIQQHLAAQAIACNRFISDKNASSPATSTTQAHLQHDNSQVDLAPIGLKLPGLTDLHELQLLKGHQNDIRARQKGDTQFYPGFSSSPMFETSSWPKRVAKKLDFVSNPINQQDEVTTPTGWVDAIPMSDDLPSTPTPRSNAVLRVVGGPTQYDEDDEETVYDAPSSPPRACNDDHAQRFTVEVEDTSVSKEQKSANDDEIQQTIRCDQQKVDTEHQNVAATSDLRSDTPLHTAQLEREAAAADFCVSAETEEEIFEDTAIDIAKTPTEKPEGCQPALQRIGNHAATTMKEMKTTMDAQASTQRQVLQGSSETRIEDSMLGLCHGQINTATTETDTETNPPRTRGQLKRKRDFEVVFTAKPARKRAKPSPFRLWDRIRGVAQADEDDIDDKTVVAISERHPSPEPTERCGASLRAEPQPSPQAQLTDKVEPMDKLTEPGVPVKRKRGRPRKSESQPLIQVGPSSVAKMEQSASVLSTANSLGQPDTSVIGETPAVAPIRKSARLSQQVVESPGSTKKVALEVPLSLPPVNQSCVKSKSGGVDGDNTVDQWDDTPSPGRQLSPDESAMALGRRIAQPKSILSRLRNILTDCTKMVFGSQEEERELDDVLFQIRCEVHEAGRQFHSRREQ